MGSTVSLSNSLTMNDDIGKNKQEIHNASGCPSIDENKGLEHMEEAGINSNIDYPRYNCLQGSSSNSDQPFLSDPSFHSFDVDVACDVYHLNLMKGSVGAPLGNPIQLKVMQSYQIPPPHYLSGLYLKLLHLAYICQIQTILPTGNYSILEIYYAVQY